MKLRISTFVVLTAVLLAAAPAFADSYQVTFGWTDPTVYLPSDTPLYEAKYRIAGGVETIIPGLTTPGGSASLTANPGQPIEFSGRQCNQGLCAPWMSWVTATAPYPVTQPQQGTGLTITVVRTGP